MTKQEAIEKSIAHWERMVAWVKTRPATDQPSVLEMRWVIKEDWFCSFCDLCKYYRTPLNVGCGECGLDCNFSNPPSPWSKVHLSKTWGEWLLAAENMIKAIKELK